MTNVSEYTVKFGKIARTLVYEDPQGGMLFGFDIEPAKDLSKGKWTLVLERQPLTLDGKRFETAIPTERLATVLERIQNYATSCGYQVVIQ
jgi:hypothetical protein